MASPLAPLAGSPGSAPAGDPPATPPAPPSQPTTPDPATPPAPAPPSQPASGSSSPPADDARIPKSRLDEEIQKRQALEAEATELRKFKEQQEDAQRTEVERAERKTQAEAERAAKAEADLRRVRIELAAGQHGALDAEAIAALLSPSSELGKAIKLDDPATVADAVAKLKEAKPALFGEAVAPRPATIGGLPLPGSITPPPAPTDPATGQPDHKLGLGTDLLRAFGRR
jgi:hypothetical protein